MTVGRFGRKFREREGVAAVEAAFVLPIVVTLMLGIWEVGRMIEVTQLVTNAAREGARVAAGGNINGTSVTVSTVQQAVKDYMTSAGLPDGCSERRTNHADESKLQYLDQSGRCPAARQVLRDGRDSLRLRIR